MNENFSSLVFFTVLCQTAAGALIFRELVLYKGGGEIATSDFGKISLMVIILLLLISLGIAFFHLGNPFHAHNALNNIGRSWLSREILSLLALITILLSYFLIITKGSPEKTGIIISVLSLLSSFSLLYCMIRLYMIPSVITWNNSFTPLSFLITAFLCGISLLAIIMGKTNDKYISIVFPLIIVFLISSLINSFLFPGSFFEQNRTLFIIRTALSVLSMLIIAVIYLRTPSNKTFILWVILFITVMSSEIVNRYIFFLSFEKSGL